MLEWRPRRIIFSIEQGIARSPAKNFCARLSIWRKIGGCFRRCRAAKKRHQKKRRRTRDFWKHFAACCSRASSKKNWLVFIAAGRSPAEFLSDKARKLSVWLA